MKLWLQFIFIAACFLGVSSPSRAVVGGPALLGGGGSGDFALVGEGNAAAPLRVADGDWPGVLRAARDLQADVERVTGRKPDLGSAVAGNSQVIIGTLGRSEVIDALIAAGKLDVGAIRGRWEAFLIQTVDHPLPGIDHALVIAGSDKRGTIYGIYELSQQIGVSPWYWWADVPVKRSETLFIKAGRHIDTGPVVKYRGIFLNDEYPALTRWVAAKFGTVTTQANPNAPANVANYGREFYTRVFEVMLRIRANYLWPAMWNNAFNEDDPENARLADEYGIVMGTSHQEPMMRAQKEWDWRFQKTLGQWNYAKHPEVLQKFWRDGIRRNKNYESLVTMGLRGANDTEMAPGGPEANRALLESIVDVQRDILREEVNPDITRVPQVWCLYKEVQEFYEHGMRVPDDVTLLWAEDNWGNVRRLPTAAERGRSGGAGVYYHFDYVGGPRSYKWINTNPLPKIWEQMSLAAKYGADRIWIVNVGHFKGYEVPMEFFIDLAWNPARWNAGNVGEFTRLWAAREFGAEHAAEIAAVVDRYAKFNGRRKPEMLRPDTYSLTSYREAETVVADYNALTARAEAVGRKLTANAQDAFYQLVLFPTKASALVNELYLAAGRNALYAEQGRASARDYAAETRAVFTRFTALMDHFNGPFVDGKWKHFMHQPVFGYTMWRDPPENSLKHLTLIEPAVPQDGALGVAVEGSAAAVGKEASLPTFDALNRQTSYIEVFNRGRTSLEFSLKADATWIKLGATAGKLGADQRIPVEIDWAQAPAGKASGVITITGGRREVQVTVNASTPTDVTRETLRGFAEGAGYVSMEAAHFTRNVSAGENRWEHIADYGRTLSGMRAVSPLDAPSATPGKDAPVLEYSVYFHTRGPAEVIAITAPTLNFVPDRGLRYAVSIDDEPAQIVTLVPQGYQAQHHNMAWEKSVADNAHYGRSKHMIGGVGYHTVKVWMVDPAVVLQKLVVDLGGLKPSYLGPPESFRGAAGLARADAATPRGDRNSQLAHEQLVAKAKQGGISLYFLGDSITRRWGATDYPDFLAHWKKTFHGWNAGNFGWGADATQHMLWRIENGELDGVNPKVIVVLAGTNNVGNKPPADEDAAVADITRGVVALVNACRARAPGATVVLMGILPRNDGPVGPVIDRVNANLATFAEGKAVRYLNLNSRLADANGVLFEGMTVDKLHLSLKGYQVWADALEPVLSELLGPRAKNDTAPPPTGDPSAKRAPTS